MFGGKLPGRLYGRSNLSCTSGVCFRHLRSCGNFGCRGPAKRSRGNNSGDRVLRFGSGSRFDHARSLEVQVMRTAQYPRLSTASS
jgi:hypothetical protein